MHQVRDALQHGDLLTLELLETGHTVYIRMTFVDSVGIGGNMSSDRQALAPFPNFGKYLPEATTTFIPWSAVMFVQRYSTSAKYEKEWQGAQPNKVDWAAAIVKAER